MKPVIQFPSGTIDARTARALAGHERNHILYAKNLPDDQRRELLRQVEAFEASHGVRPESDWDRSHDACVNPSVADVPE